MSGFAAWVQGPGGIAVLTPCALAVGWINGWLTRSLVQDRRERKARERKEAMARRTHPVYRQPPASDRFAAIREAGRRAWAIQQQRAADQQAHEAWLAHSEQAIALTREETDEEFSARLAATADEIIAWAHAAVGPYPGGDQ